jgi:hypothetical protein
LSRESIHLFCFFSLSWASDSYEPHLPTIPYEAPDPGSLPTGPKVAEVTRRQVMPKMIPVKRFMRGVYAALAAQTNPDAGAPKSPRGGKFSPRKKGTSDEASLQLIVFFSLS